MSDLKNIVITGKTIKEIAILIDERSPNKKLTSVKLIAKLRSIYFGV